MIDNRTNSFFDEALYLATFSDIAERVKLGEYTSGLDYYNKVGQFEGEELREGFFTGTPGNDIVTGFGADTDLFGIGYKDITTLQDGTVTLIPTSLGVGEIDVLLGGENFNGNYLLAYKSFNFDTLIAETVPLYVGQGDKDFALVQNLDPSNGYITFATQDFSEYDFKVDGQGFKIYYNDDLIGIAENVYDLQVGLYDKGLGFGALSKTTESGKATGGFDEDLYLLSTPDAVAGVASGAFKSGLEYYVKVGQYTVNAEGEPGEGFFTGTSGNDYMIGFGANAGLSGVGITAVDAKNGSYTYDSYGVGEIDVLIGGEGENGFLLGTITNSGTPEAKPFYVGNGDEDYATIINFDPTRDYISLANSANPEILPHFSFKDQYILESTEEGTKIFTKAGDLVAVVEGVTELVPFTGITPDGTIQLVSLENEFFSKYIEPNFFEPWYLEFDKSDYDNSVQKAIDAGLVKTPYEHYLKFGQFEAREDSIFAASTSGNNTLYGSGYENGLVGVQISVGVYTRDVTPIGTGVGEVDTLIGAPGEDTFFLGNGSVINDTPQPFYVGQGDKDYALIKNFNNGSSSGQLLSESSFAEFYPDAPADARESLTDRIVLAGKAYDYTFEKVEDDLKISYQGDLIAIIEDAPPLDVPFSIPGATYLYTTGNEAAFGEIDGFGSAARFYDPFYLAENPDVEQAIERGEYKSAFEHYIKVGQFNSDGEAIFSGTSGDDFIAGFGSNDLLIATEVTFVDGEKEGYRTASTGMGEDDFVVGGLGVSTFVIGNDNLLDPEKGGEVWYVGKGDEDYLSIQGFDPYKDVLFGAGQFEDYSFETIEETDEIFGRQVPYQSLEVSYKGDRVALLKSTDGSLTTPNITELQPLPLGNERPNGLALVAAQNQFLMS